MSLAQHLQKAQTLPRPRAVRRQRSEDTEFSESAWSMASSLRSSFKSKGVCRFSPSDAFSPEENAILLKLSQELNSLNQDDIMSIVEEFTLASKRESASSKSSSRRDSQSTLEDGPSPRISRLSVASMTILEGLEGWESEDDEEEQDNNNDVDEEVNQPPIEKEDEVTVSETQFEDEEQEEEQEEVGKLMKSEHTMVVNNRARNLNRTRRRSTLLDIIDSRRPSALVDFLQQGAETWTKNMETILTGGWTGKVVNTDLQSEEDEFSDDEEE